MFGRAPGKHKMHSKCLENPSIYWVIDSIVSFLAAPLANSSKSTCKLKWHFSFGTFPMFPIYHVLPNALMSSSPINEETIQLFQEPWKISNIYL